MTDRQIEPILGRRDEQKKLQADLEATRRALMEAEAELAEYQAAVNAFRMHCRLKLDDLVDELLVLGAQQQSLLTRLQLLRQEDESLTGEDEADPFTHAEETVDDEDEEELILPTDVSRDKAAEKRLYRELARRFHPDLANTAVERAYCTSMMSAVNIAYEKQNIQALYDLAGELEPSAIAELDGIEMPAIRKLRRQIMQAQRLRRKAKQQLKAAKLENTARLYHRAQRLEEEGDNWWDIVRRELEVAIERRQQEIAELKTKLARFESPAEKSQVSPQ
ncbi:MAG: hypothetical protein GY803_12450 [Chloroflexi bacterium]|nr:hypothetical protein [Chloroflexota bacterium]